MSLSFLLVLVILIGLIGLRNVGTNWRYRVHVCGDVGTIVPFWVRIILGEALYGYAGFDAPE